MTGRRGGLLRQRNFRLFWTGESISEVGNSVTLVVIPLIAIDTLHTSTFIVTLLTAMVWLPWVIIGIPAGAWVDRLPPRPVMLVSDAISVAVYASVPVAAWCGVLTVAQLIAVTLMAGAAAVFFNSAYQVLLPGVVDEADLTEGNAKLLGSREVAQIGGPGLGGLLAQAAGPVTGLLADAVSFAVSFCCLTAMQPPRDRRSGALASGGVLDGLRFAWRDPYLRAMTAFSSFGNLALTGVDALLVVFLVRTVGLSSAAAGLVMASLGVGGVLGALVARPLGRRFGTARAVLIAIPGGQCFALLLPLADSGPRLAFAAVAMMCSGCVIVIANVIVDSFMQTYVSPGILGRVTSATRAVGFAMMPVGALLAGVLATSLGIRDALWILTALIAASGLTFLLTPMRHLRDLPRRPGEDRGKAEAGAPKLKSAWCFLVRGQACSTVTQSHPAHQSVTGKLLASPQGRHCARGGGVVIQQRQHEVTGPPYEALDADWHENRDHILEVARGALAASSDVSLNSIAKRAGVGPGTLYQYFPTRETLVLAVYRHNVQQLVDSAAVLLKEHPPLDALRLWFDRLAYYGRIRHGAADVLHPTTSDGLAGETCGPIIRAIAMLLRAGEEVGSIRPGLDPDDVLLLMGFLLRMDASDDWQERARRMVDLVMDGLRADAPAAALAGTGSAR